MTSSQSTPAASPCIRVCRIDRENRLCEGCFRTLDEIAAWPRMSDAERIAVNERLAERRRDAGDAGAG